VKKRGADLRKTSDALLAEIGERRRADEALGASEQRLQDILDNTTAVVFVKDLDLRYILVNREYERRHQVRRDEICGKTDFDIFPHDVAETVRANDRHVIEAGTPIQFEETVPMTQEERQYVVVKFLLRDRTTKPYAICGIATDITELRRAEELQARRTRYAALRADIHFHSAKPLEEVLGLTPRVAETLLWLTQGKTNGEIASILGNSESTVKKHVLEIFVKLGVETRTAASLRGLEVLSSSAARG
jgi:PAS domain S-box-containing protein